MDTINHDESTLEKCIEKKNSLQLAALMASKGTLKTLVKNRLRSPVCMEHKSATASVLKNTVEVPVLILRKIRRIIMLPKDPMTRIIGGPIFQIQAIAILKELLIPAVSLNLL